MTAAPTRDYALLDHPAVLRGVFHPRPAFDDASGAGTQVLIPVDGDTVIGARFHAVARSGPSILFFHGNGEIAEDYDELAPFYEELGINFLVVDYRGYGRSTGRPSSSAMIRDSHTIFDFTTTWLADHGYDGCVIPMGRSLGSVSALEIAAHHQDRVAGVIIESGFAYTIPLLGVVGVDARALGLEERDGFGNLDKIRSFGKPTLVIHAERDHLIPLSDAQALHDASPAADKHLVTIAGANHNNILAYGLPEYMKAIAAFCAALR